MTEPPKREHGIWVRSGNIWVLYGLTADGKIDFTKKYETWSDSSSAEPYSPDIDRNLSEKIAVDTSLARKGIVAGNIVSALVEGHQQQKIAAVQEAQTKVDRLIRKWNEIHAFNKDKPTEWSEGVLNSIKNQINELDQVVAEGKNATTIVKVVKTATKFLSELDKVLKFGGPAVAVATELIAGVSDAGEKYPHRVVNGRAQDFKNIQMP